MAERPDPLAQPELAEEGSATTGTHAPREVVPQWAQGLLVGLLSTAFFMCSGWTFLVMATGGWGLAELLALPIGIGGGFVAGSGAVSPSLAARTGAWGAGGLGAGLMLDALISGGLSVGTFLTPSGIVLGFVFAGVGLRAGRRAGN